MFDQIKRIKASLLQKGDLLIESEPCAQRRVLPLTRVVHRKEQKDVLVWREQDMDAPWDALSIDKYVTIYRSSEERPVCPDGGTCHHACTGRDCFRVDCCEPLSGVYVDDSWPEALRR